MSKRNWSAGFAIGLVVGIGLALLFLVWAVPEFREPEIAQQYYENWEATSNPGQNQDQNDTHFWIRELYGWVYAEDTLAQWLMAVLGFAATGISVIALVWLARTFRETRNANVINSPPKLFVSHIVFDILGGEQDGKVHIYNNGAHPASEILRSTIHVLITGDRYLPATHPTVNLPDRNRIDLKSMAPGEVAWWEFKVEEPIDAARIGSIMNGGLKAYVVGMMRYRDDLGTRHDTFFCRKFHPKSKRWKRVEDDEYEYQN